MFFFCKANWYQTKNSQRHQWNRQNICYKTEIIISIGWDRLDATCFCSCDTIVHETWVNPGDSSGCPCELMMNQPDCQIKTKAHICYPASCISSCSYALVRYIITCLRFYLQQNHVSYFDSLAYQPQQNVMTTTAAACFQRVSTTVQTEINSRKKNLCGKRRAEDERRNEWQL